MDNKLEKLIDEYLSVCGKKDRMKYSEEEYQKYVRIKKELPLRCASLTQAWRDYMLQVFDTKLYKESKELWESYKDAKEQYLLLGTAALALRDWVSINLNYSQKDNEFRKEIKTLVMPALNRIKDITKEFRNNKSTAIQHMLPHLNFFKMIDGVNLTEADAMSSELPIPPSTVNWDEAIKAAKGTTLMIHWGAFSKQEFKDLQKRTDLALEDYSLAVLTQRKCLSRKKSDLRSARDAATPLHAVFGYTSNASAKSVEDKKKYYRLIVESGKGKYFSGRQISVACPYSEEAKEFERKWGVPVNNVIRRLCDIESNQDYIARSLNELTEYYPDVYGDAIDFFKSGQTLLYKHLPKNKLRKIRCRSAATLDSDCKAKLTELLKTFEDEMGFAPSPGIFTNLHDTDERLPVFLDAMKSFEASKTALLTEEIEKIRTKNDKLSGDLSTRKNSIISEIRSLADADPVANGFWYKGSKHTQESAGKVCNVIAGNASGRFSLPWFVNPLQARYSGYTFPDIIKWQTPGTRNNLEYVYSGPDSKKQAERCLNTNLLSILLAFPIKSVKISFIDPGTTNDCSFFTTRIGTQICSVINRETDVRQLIEQWQAKAAMVGKYTSDLVEYNNKEKAFLAPYELVVLLGSFSPSLYAQLEPFIQNGYKYGVYFFSFSQGSRGELFNNVTWKTDWPTYTDNCISLSPLDDAILMDTLTGYINKMASKEVTVQAISQDISSLATRPYGDAIQDFSVPVGEVNGHPVNFKLSNQHIHSFVIGQTGQGKSVFLHDVISGAVLGYSPEQFQVYLLDFKLAGEELYHYRGVKHVRALLANGSDLQLTYEILNDLKKQMEERSSLMREMGARTIEEYDRVAQRKFPRILLVVDECQELFRDNTHRQVGEGSIMIGIRSIIEDVARKGRSQGVHLLFATQTLSGTQLPPVIKNNITDYFLFKCVQEDAEQLVPGSSKKVLQLKVGHLLYNSTDGETTFQAYLPDVGAMVRQAVLKSSAVSVEQPGFVFDGSNESKFGSEELESIRETTTRNLRYIIGKSADVKRSSIEGVLKNDMGENLLFVGYNASQVARASFSALLSMMVSNKVGNLGYSFYCLDLLQSEDPDVFLPLEELTGYGLRMVPQSRSGDLISKLANDIREGVMNKSVLFILGQERFKAVRDEYELQGEPATASDNTTPRSFGRPQPKTYRSELKYILENGPEMGVHTILQIDRLSKLLFESSVNSRFVYRMFSYVCLLRTEKDAETRLGLDGIYPQQLSDQDSNLGAWFINDGIGKNDKFTPFVRLDKTIINEVLK